ncbi:hypothetical protein BGW38_006817 [Lunasporangiospora selenospora]|uniref:CubicO group peptidase, beta-lactamase class C family n=1 Tax=Lunasporangiospora selenospora TaxID=979761 RepID=A0A9P6FYX1_9FUNG|nr:hypothetical protein BGW38_006817 [Lunasporangiospora selenospora]
MVVIDRQWYKYQAGEHYLIVIFSTMRYSPTLLITVTLSAALTLLRGGMAAPRNLTQEDFRQWTETIKKAGTNIGIQGMSVAVVYKGETIYSQAFGKKNSKDPFTIETVTNIASLTKAFTAAAVGELVAEGKADWETPVNEYVPEFKSKNPYLTADINLVDLLAHRAGYPMLDFHWFHRNESRPELIKQLRNVEPVAPIRTKWIYNNILYAVAGEASGRIEGKSWEEVVRDKILIPAGMSSSGFSTKTMLTRPNHALGFASKSFEASQRGENYQIPPDTSRLTDAPSGDMFSNVIDLAKWAKLMLRQGKLNGKQVLHKETVEAVTKSWMAVGHGSVTYGLGWMIDDYKGHRMVSHAGANPGFRSHLALFPNEDLALIMLSNKDINEIVSLLALYLADYILDLSKTEDWLFKYLVETDRRYYNNRTPTSLEAFFPPQIKNKPPTRRLEDFAGEYTHSYGPAISFTLKGKGAKASLAFKLTAYEGTLEHYHYDSFRLRLIHAGNTMTGLLSFVTGNNGSVQQLRFTTSDETMVYTKTARA